MSVADALLGKRPRALASLEGFSGAGVYVIYYIGAFPAYEVVAQRNREEKFEAPIYVGQAVPAGGRKGKASTIATRALHKRLAEHADSIRSVNNLYIEDFFCRFIIVDEIWISLAESLLIAKFAPVWNTIIDGFGNHDPGRGRYLGMRPRWDVLHPGRAWASRCADRSETADQIVSDVEEHLRAIPPPKSPGLHAEQCAVDTMPDYWRRLRLI